MSKGSGQPIHNLHRGCGIGLGHKQVPSRSQFQKTHGRITHHLAQSHQHEGTTQFDHTQQFSWLGSVQLNEVQNEIPGFKSPPLGIEQLRHGSMGARFRWRDANGSTQIILGSHQITGTQMPIERDQPIFQSLIALEGPQFSSDGCGFGKITLGSVHRSNRMQGNPVTGRLNQDTLSQLECRFHLALLKQLPRLLTRRARRLLALEWITRNLIRRGSYGCWIVCTTNQ